MDNTKYFSLFIIAICLFGVRAGYVCSENEKLDNCKNPCLPSCQEPKRQPCPTFTCSKGCVCKPGYIRDEVSGQCILPQFCPQFCPPNEEPKGCNNTCEATCQNKKYGIQCILQNSNCVCQSGFWRDLDSGACVLPESCPKTCGKNQEWNYCNPPSECRRTCQSRLRPSGICAAICVEGCECVEGFLWDEISQKCVPECKCPTVCQENEVWSECSDRACRETCQNPYRRLCKLNCKPGCSCRKGFLWDDYYQKCVPPTLCSKDEQSACAENEELSYCKHPYLPTCQDPSRQPDEPIECTKGCVCKPDFLRNENSGDCVPAAICPAALCSENEEPNSAEKKCEPTCQTSIRCAVRNKGCVCKNGYVRDLLSGKCYLPETCPKECGVNEDWSLCSMPEPCRASCEDPSRGMLCRIACRPGCDCKEGYLWNSTIKQCVVKCQCANACGRNEEWKECSDKNCRSTCQNPGPLMCPLIICTPGCSCKVGFIWDEISSSCIPKEQCPKVCGKNQEWQKCSDIKCRRTCQHPEPQNCPLICIPGCSCKAGFIWDELSSSCVPEAQCCNNCGANQEWRQCSDKHCRRTCQNPLPRPCPKICEPGCSCKVGFIWDELSSSCVLEQQCLKQCGFNEEWAACAPPESCRGSCQENSSPKIKCLYPCQPGCTCKPGYLWDKSLQQCVPEQQCPSVCNKTQEWRQCSDKFCRRTCQNPQPRFCPEICEPGCSCKVGFIWDELSSSCVSEKQCPKLCGENQEWQRCSDKYCRRTCQNLQPGSCPYACEPGCSCKVGFIWDELSSSCVSENQCPKQCGINQEWAACAPSEVCRPSCQEDNSPQIMCTYICQPGCACKPGYLWSKSLQQCVPEQQCPSVCGKNQEWRQCSDKPCRRTCQNPLPRPCPKICEPGCSCKEGFIWDELSSSCIPEGQCTKRCDANQEWATCAPPDSCRPSCEDPRALIACTYICQPGYICKQGYLWSRALQQCVPECQCLT